MTEHPNSRGDVYLPVFGRHDADDQTDFRIETDDVIADVSYNPERLDDHDVSSVVDRRISPGESPGPDLTP